MTHYYNRVSYVAGFPQRYIDQFQTILQHTDLSITLNASSQKYADRFFANSNVSKDLQDAASTLFSNGFSQTDMVSPKIKSMFVYDLDCVIVECLNNHYVVKMYIDQQSTTKVSQSLNDIGF